MLQLLSNVRLFGEGVDVPALDAIVFMEPRDSQVDVVQAVGRVMRRSEETGKRFGYIVVPVPIEPGGDIAGALSQGSTGYQAVGKVLRALSAWWNSTPTLLVLLNHRTKKLTYPSWSLAQLQRIPVPKPGNNGWFALAQAWRKACDMELLPLRDAEQCQARRIIDEAAALVLNVSPEEIADWRRRLSAEPTITNRRAARE